MWTNSLSILVILIGSQTVPAKSLILFGNQLNLRLCTSMESIAVQVITKHAETGITCQCQASPPRDPLTKEDYVHTPGIGMHKLHTEAKSWNEARKICSEENAHLAIINSRAEETLLVDMLKKAGPSIKGGLNTEEALLGIHDLYKEGEWVTIFGESIYATGFSHWSPTYWGGQPDNYDGRQNCGAIINDGGMDDVFCHDKFAFFCEMPLSC